MLRSPGSAGMASYLASAGIAGFIPEGALIGDSISKPDYTNSDRVNPTSATNWNKSSNGFMAWALALSGQRVSLPANTNVWSFPGYRAEVIVTYLDAFLAQLPRKPGFVVVECGTNDVVANRTFAQITETYSTFIQALSSRGIRVIFVPILPRNSTDFTQARADVAIRVNGWLREVALRSGGVVAVADCIRSLSLLTSTLYEPLASPAIYYDSPLTHPNTLGAYYIGKAVAAILNQWYPALDLLPTSSLAWDATNSPGANYLLNSMFQGTGGTVVAGTGGATTSGTAPTSWRFDMSATSGLTAAGSLVTSAIDSMPMWQCVLGGSYTTSGISTPNTSVFARLQRTITAGDASLNAIQAGDTFEALVACEIDTGNNSIQCPQLEWRWDGSNQNSDMRHAATSQGDLPAGEAIKAVFRTPPHTFDAAPVGSQQINLTAFLKSVTGSYSPAATIRWGRPVLRKVVG